ncbi:hypothetical protein AAHA92_24827 [Salvia divinorum]|uniref:Retrotransposon Copia-like N-terminal domain-containing protein n=1 Tax=Salvia divinorum TaxID=28513 RepID=A0ABD1G8N3_SALDI
MTETKPEIADKIRTSKNITIAFKLNDSNYPLWARLMKVSIGSREAYRHITGIPTPPEPEETGYIEWEEIDLIVFSWIVDNMETNIIADFAHHQTAKSLWDNLAVTFKSSADPYLVYDLEDKANKIIQGDLSLEAYWSHLQGLWIDIDRCQSKPIDCCDKGVAQYRKHSSKQKLFKFLTGLNEKYDGIRRDILKESIHPSVDAAYGWVKLEATRLKIMPPTSTSPPIAVGNDSSSGVGFGFGAREYRPSQPPNKNQQTPSRFAAANRRGNKPDKSKLWCTHCGMQKHTRDTCFQIVGYPDWWEEEKAAKGKVAIGVEGGGRNPTGTGAGSQETSHIQERKPETGGFQTGGGRRGDGGRGKMAEAMAASLWTDGGGNGGYPDGEDHWTWH